MMLISPKIQDLFVIVQKAQNVIPLKLLPPFQKIQLNRKSKPGNLPAKLPNKLHRGLHRPTSGQQIVDNHHALPRLNRIRESPANPSRTPGRSSPEPLRGSFFGFRTGTNPAFNR